MPAYHSSFLETEQSVIGNFALLPIRTRIRGPATTLPPLQDEDERYLSPAHESYDCLDEIIALFRANTLFRNFEIKGPGDRVMIYGILYLSELLSKLKADVGKREGEKIIMTVATNNNFAMPGDPGFPLNQSFEKPQNRNDAEILRQYIFQMRQELARRLLVRLYENDLPSKWWLSFSRRKFMGKSL